MVDRERVVDNKLSPDDVVDLPRYGECFKAVAQIVFIVGGWASADEKVLLAGRIRVSSERVGGAVVTWVRKGVLRWRIDGVFVGQDRRGEGGYRGCVHVGVDNPCLLE